MYSAFSRFSQTPKIRLRSVEHTLLFRYTHCFSSHSHLNQNPTNQICKCYSTRSHLYLARNWNMKPSNWISAISTKLKGIRNATDSLEEAWIEFISVVLNMKICNLTASQTVFLSHCRQSRWTRLDNVVWNFWSGTKTSLLSCTLLCYGDAILFWIFAILISI